VALCKGVRLSCLNKGNLLTYLLFAFVTGYGVVTFGLTAIICIYLACMALRHKTDFEFETGLVLMPDNIVSHQRRFLQLFVSKL